MAKKKTTCPEPEVFLKWFEQTAANNANSRPDIVQLESAWIPIVATEQQINAEYKLAKKNFEAGDVLTKLEQCALPIEVYNNTLHDDEGFLIQFVEGKGPRLK